MRNFWEKLKKRGRPIYALAPMAGYTDSAMRRICKKFGADVVYSEMASATALVYDPVKTLGMLKFDPVERPYVVQLFGAKPDHFAAAARLISDKIGPDGIDINFGCPVKKVAKQGAGAVLMDNMPLARKIIESTIDNTNLPVSIKTRTRVNRTGLIDFLEFIKDLNISAIMIHGRTLKQGFAGTIDTGIIKKARDHFGGVILANGGVGVTVTPPSSAPLRHPPLIRGGTGRGVAAPRARGADVKSCVEELLAETGADGVGIARGALGRPWIFKAVRTGQSLARSPRAVFKIALEHARLAEGLKGGRGIVEMRGQLCAYAAGLSGAKELRRELVRVNTFKEIEGVFGEYLKSI
ncbi:MAG: tRNA-dihydrouridine synthase family protein [Candidatus Falkowbacteria bacterium]